MAENTNPENPQTWTPPQSVQPGAAQPAAPQPAADQPTEPTAAAEQPTTAAASQTGAPQSSAASSQTGDDGAQPESTATQGYPTYGGYADQPDYSSQPGYYGGSYAGYGTSEGYANATGYTGAQGYGSYGSYPEAPTYAETGSYAGTTVADPPKPARARRTVLTAVIVAALIGGGVGAGTVAVADHKDSSSNTVASGVRVTTDTASVAKLDGSITAAAAKIQPSVVTIDVTGSSESGTGSGVIIRSDGYILTNDHVVSVAGTGGTITVVTNDGRSVPATIVGVDASDDLAVVKVNLTGLTAATFAKSSELQVGQSVVAVGAPLGLSDTVTSGIVSTLSRPVRSGDNDQAVFDAVQTDAAINPGNSGGPLVDLNGDVIGINAAIATSGSGGVQVPGQTTQSGNIGIGFAIPSDEASRIASELIATGKASHAVLGVSVKSDSSSSQTATPGTGATIATVTASGAASKAGIQAGDVVTKVGSQRIQDGDGLIAAIRSYSPGQTAAITITRGGTSKTVNATLGTASS